MEKIHHIVKFEGKDNNKVTYKIYYKTGNVRTVMSSLTLPKSAVNFIDRSMVKTHACFETTKITRYY